jgi:hypothetical protein
MLPALMKPRGAFKISNQGSALDGLLDPIARSDERARRVVESLRNQIAEGGAQSLRIRQVFQSPREIYRLELELPDLGCQRTTLLDREAVEELLETEEVRAAFGSSTPGN